MAQAFTSILGELGKIGGALSSGGLGKGLGTLGGLAGLVNQYSLAAKEKKALDQSLWYSKHPQAISALTSQFTRPLDTGLTKGVENVVNANLASQGLSQAPGIQSQVLAQALAPYYQQNQNTALQEALAAIGLPAEALQSLQSTQGNQAGIASLLKGLFPQNAAVFNTAGTSPDFNDPGITFGPGSGAPGSDVPGITG